MASPSQCQWSMMKATDSSTVELSTFPCRSSIFFSCHVRRRHFFNFAAQNNSSSSSSSSSSISASSTSNSGSRSKRLRGSDDYGKKLTEGADCGKDDVALVALNGIRAQRRRKLNFKSLFERRSLWRRILFASKKVRSIILLNVITVIYGILSLFVKVLIILNFIAARRLRRFQEHVQSDKGN